MQRDIRSLTGIRGVAACLVMFYHFTAGGVGPAPVKTFIAHGYLAVDLFFVLSGFVMAMTYGGLFEFRFSPREYGRFLAKRLGRVYPLYIATTVLLTVLGATGVNRIWLQPAGRVVSNVLLMQTWGFDWSINQPGWSISTEWAAYLLFPLLARACLFGRRGTAAGAGAAALLAILWLSLQSAAFVGCVGHSGPLDIYNGMTPWPLLRCIAGFCLGLAAWRASSEARVHEFARRPWVGGVTGLLILALLTVRGSDVALVALFPVLIVCLGAAREAPAARLMACGPVHWLGLVSYSIYLVHYPIQQLRQPLQDTLAAIGVPHSFTAASVLLMAATMGVAAITFAWIEEPFRRLSRRWIGRDAPRLPAGSEPVTAP